MSSLELLLFLLNVLVKACTIEARRDVVPELALDQMLSRRRWSGGLFFRSSAATAASDLRRRFPAPPRP